MSGEGFLAYLLSLIDGGGCPGFRPSLTSVARLPSPDMPCTCRGEEGMRLDAVTMRVGWMMLLLLAAVRSATA